MKALKQKLRVQEVNGYRMIIFCSGGGGDQNVLIADKVAGNEAKSQNLAIFTFLFKVDEL